MVVVCCCLIVLLPACQLAVRNVIVENIPTYIPYHTCIRALMSEGAKNVCVCMYLLPNAYYSWCECMFEQSKQQQQQNNQRKNQRISFKQWVAVFYKIIKNKILLKNESRRKNMGNNFISSPKCALMPNLLLLNFYNNNTFPKGGLLPPSLWAVLSSVMPKIMPFSQHQSGRQNIAISFLPLSPLCVLYS